MATETTYGVKISVESYYQSEYSKPLENEFLFAYRVSIENHSEYTIQLLRRHWHIIDSNGSKREVEGEGVVGKQPILEPGETYQYVSGCHLKSAIGKMYGTYQIQKRIDGKIFAVKIPAFKLIAPFKQN